MSSNVWLIFSRSADDKKVGCDHCDTEFKFHTSTTTMMNHIRSKHNELFKKKLEEQKMSDSAGKRDKQIQDNLLVDATGELVLALCEASIPFNFLRNKHFQKFCKILCAKYKLISPDAVIRFLEKNKQDYKKKLQQELRRNSQRKYFISFDGWDMKSEKLSVYAVLIYYVTDSFERKCNLLGLKKVDGPSTSRNIGEIVGEILGEYGLDFSHILGAVSDGASNLKSLLASNEIYHIHCESHLLALVLKEGTSAPNIKEILDLVQEMANHLSRSRTDRGKLRERSKRLGNTGPLPLPFSSTRWGASIALLRNYMNHVDGLSCAPSFQRYTLKETQKVRLEKFIEAAEPILSVLTNAESNTSYASESITEYAALLDNLKQKSATEELKRMCSDLTSRFTENCDNDCLLIASYFDPRFAYLEGVIRGKTWEYIESVVCLYVESLKVLPETERPAKQARHDDSILSRFVSSHVAFDSTENNVKVEAVKYKSFLLTSRPSIAADPLSFWRDNSKNYPKLAEASKHFLSIPKSSSQVERIFSRCRDVASPPKRNRMKSSTLESILLNVALDRMNRFELDEDDVSDEMSSSDDEDDEDLNAEISNEKEKNVESTSNNLADGDVEVLDNSNAIAQGDLNAIAHGADIEVSVNSEQDDAAANKENIEEPEISNQNNVDSGPEDFE